MDLPVICTLSESELKERRRTILDVVRDSVIGTTPLPGGYAYHVLPTSEAFERVCNLVNLERQCCRFLTFKIVAEPEKPLTVEITGPVEAKPVIAEFFGNGA